MKPTGFPAGNSDHTDISRYRAGTDRPVIPIEETNEARKHGVKYLMYAMSQ
jgi:hypothetical protein